MTPQEALVEQICALPLAERLQIRAALDESVERDLADNALEQGTAADWSAARERLEAELLRGLDSGPPIAVDETYWQELHGRIERRRQMSAS
ncbi:MAG: hypothetical protein Q8K78_16475 [Planctomycetaceae bacterium]|nr:hypothetical protein [Planctomycetaceae bacterium]